MNEIITNSIIPIWIMAALCVLLIVTGVRKSISVIIRRVLISVLLFLINIRIMVPGEPVDIQKQELNSYCLFVVDNTISMLALDGHGNESRMDSLKADCEYIVDGLVGAHFSVMTFDNAAYVRSPFSDNAEHAKNTINSLYPPDYYYCTGSSMSVARQPMIDFLKEAGERKGIKLFVFFISDGEDNSDTELESYKEISKYIDGGAVLGYGTKEGAAMRYVSRYDSNSVETITTWDSETFDMVPAISKMDEYNLKKIASDMGVEYIHMDKAEDVKGIISDIVSKSEVVTTDHSITTMDTAKDTYYLFVFPLILLLVWEAADILLKKR